MRSIITLVSGVRYWDLRESDGSEVVAGDEVTIYYQLGLGDLGDRDGPWIDDSWIRDRALTFKVGAGEVLRGIDEGIIGMRVAAERRLVLPPGMAYGNRGLGDRVPPASTLTVHVHLIEIR